MFVQATKNLSLGFSLHEPNRFCASAVKIYGNLWFPCRLKYAPNCMEWSHFSLYDDIFQSSSYLRTNENIDSDGSFLCLLSRFTAPIRVVCSLPVQRRKTAESQKAREFFVRVFHLRNSIRSVCTDMKLMDRRNSVHSRFDPETRITLSIFIRIS